VKSQWRDLIETRLNKTAVQRASYGDFSEVLAARAPVRKLRVVEPLGYTRVPFAGRRPDHGAGVELAVIDAHRAAEARKRRPTSNVDSMIVLGASRGGTGSKYMTMRGGLRRAIPILLVLPA